MANSSLSGSSVTKGLIHNAMVSNGYSKKYISKLVSTAIGLILYQRTDLDRGDFKEFICNGFVYNMFKRKVKNSDVKEVCGWIAGAIDAFKRNYLKELYLIFTDMFNSQILESYKFEFTYKEDNVASDKLLVEQNLREATDKLFLSISKLDMEKLKIDDFIPYIHLTYNDNVPADYEPPYIENDPYKQHTNIMLENFLQLGKDITILGCVDTSFHLVQCQFQIDESVQTNFDTSDTLTKSVFKVFNSNSRQDSTDSEKNLVKLFMKIDCYCLLIKRFDNIELIKCSKCFRLQHVSCLGFLFLDDICNPYICQKCKDNAFIFFNHRFPYAIIDDFCKTFGEKIIIRLKNMQIIDCIDGMYLIKDNINSVIDACFFTMEAK